MKKEDKKELIMGEAIPLAKELSTEEKAPKPDALPAKDKAPTPREPKPPERFPAYVYAIPPGSRGVRVEPGVVDKNRPEGMPDLSSNPAFQEGFAYQGFWSPEEKVFYLLYLVAKDASPLPAAEHLLRMRSRAFPGIKEALGDACTLFAVPAIKVADIEGFRSLTARYKDVGVL